MEDSLLPDGKHCSSRLYELCVCTNSFADFAKMPHLLENIKVWIQYNAAHISNHVVVPAFGSVHSQDPKHKENHGSGVDQRTHRWLAAHTAAARIEAKRFGWFRFGSR